MVESYDSLIERAVPRYQEMTDRLLDYLPRGSKRILELGCGTGNLSLRLAREFPEAALTLVDAAREMTSLTQARIEGQGLDPRGRVSCVTARFEDLSFAPGSFDLATSCISLHHVRDKAGLYLELFEAIAPGGVLCFADQLRGGTEAIHERNWERWIEFCRLPGHCSEEEIRSLLDHAAAHDHYTPLAEHFALLHKAGFVGMDCLWRNWIWGIIIAMKPAA